MHDAPTGKGGVIIETYSSPNDEVRALADAQFDGRLTHHQTERLELLLLADLGCMQAYIERMVFHAELLKDADQRSARGVLNSVVTSIHQRERRSQLTRDWVPALTGALCLLIATGYLFGAGFFAFERPPLVVVSSLSSNARVQLTDVDLGQVVRLGDSFSVEEGIVSLQFPHVLIDLIGPVTARIESADKLSITSGTIVAKILKTGERFCITTPDVEVIDLGTEFLVQHQPGRGTDVSVRQGRVRATLLDWRKKPQKVMELTDHRSANFQGVAGTVKEMDFRPETFAPVDRSRVGIHRIDSMLRTGTQQPVSLRSGQSDTFNHILVIPERQGIVLQQDLSVMGVEGPILIPAGTTVSSYLIHYDPPEIISRAPRGAVTFFERVAGVIASSEELHKTDELLGLQGVEYESAAFRGGEFGPDEDSIQISHDRKTVSFRFDTSPPRYLDEARVIIIAEADHSVP